MAPQRRYVNAAGIEPAGPDRSANGTLVLTVVTNVNAPIAAGVTQIANLRVRNRHDAAGVHDDARTAVRDHADGGLVTIAKALTGETGTQTGIAEAGEA